MGYGPYVWKTLVGKLGHEEDLVALTWIASELPAEQVFAVGVHVGHILEELIILIGGIEDGEALAVRFVGAVEGGEIHGAEAEGGDKGPCLSRQMLGSWGGRT
jgi:hypothetical protein